MSIILTRLHTSWSSKKPWIDKWFLDNDTVDKHEKTELLNSLLYSIAHKNVSVGYALCLNTKKNCVEGWCSESSGTERDIWKYIWNVIVYDDPVNLMSFVTLVLKRVFGYPQEKAEALMLEVHRNGLSVVWSGEREKAELYVQQLQSHQLLAAMKKS